jgi:hypothetical protein
MNNDVVSIGKLADYPRELWGSRDHARALAAQREATALDPYPIEPQHLLPAGFGGLYGPEQPHHGRGTRARAVDQLLSKLGIRLRP